MRPDVGTQAQFRKKKPPATVEEASQLDPPGNIVTAYPPDPAEWMPDLKTRRTAP